VKIYTANGQLVKFDFGRRVLVDTWNEASEFTETGVYNHLEPGDLVCKDMWQYMQFTLERIIWRSPVEF